MANLQSQKKRNRQTVGRTERNKALRSELKTRTKTALDAAEAGNAEAAREALSMAQRRIDMAATKGLLHRSTASRQKARLTRQVNQLLG